VSIVSRSPSPVPQGKKKNSGVYGYDEHVGGVEREVITIETKLKDSNKGFALLAKMGWKAGEGLGVAGQGAYMSSYKSIPIAYVYCCFDSQVGLIPFHLRLNVTPSDSARLRWTIGWLSRPSLNVVNLTQNAWSRRPKSNDSSEKYICFWK